LVVDALIMFPKLSKDMVGINKIAKSIEANGSKKKKVGLHFTTKGLSRNMSQGKRPNNLGHHTNTKDKPRYNFQQGGTQGGKPPMLERKKVALWY
jgi:hypothetical protein